MKKNTFIDLFKSVRFYAVIWKDNLLTNEKLVKLVYVAQISFAVLCKGILKDECLFVFQKVKDGIILMVNPS